MELLFTLESFLEWSGSITGLAGAALLATNTRYSGWGFVLFLFSNVAWGWFGLITGTHGILLMQVGFTATSLLGIWRWRHALLGRTPLSVSVQES